jgi:hypothetical protein
MYYLYLKIPNTIPIIRTTEKLLTLREEIRSEDRELIIR